MAIYGIGSDIIQISRVEGAVLRTGGHRLAKRVLSNLELQAYKINKTPIYFLAKRFAAKEAAAKAFGFGMRFGLSYSQFEILNDSLGKPKLYLLSHAAILANELSILHIHITISDDVSHAYATVIFEN